VESVNVRSTNEGRRDPVWMGTLLPAEGAGQGLCGVGRRENRPRGPWARRLVNGGSRL